MNKKLLKYFALIGLIGLLFSCQKDETRAVLLDNPTLPTIQTMPGLTLKRTDGTNLLTFVGTPLEAGFQASVTYYLEACAKGNNFQDAVQIASDIQDLSIQISVSDLNGMLLKKFPADQVSSLDFRIRSVLSLSSGTGSYVYNSAVKTVDVSLYGLPRLDLVGSGITQKIESALGDGKYVGYVKLDATKSFTLKDPDANITYGGSNGVLAANGSALSVTAKGWYKLTADTKALTFSLAPYNVGVVGAFSGWGGSSDSFMDYDLAKGYWFITMDLPAGPMKFRLNSDWAVNWGPGSDTNLPATGGTMALPNGSGNIVLAAGGNYTVQFTITGSSGSVTFIKNN